MVAWEAMRSGGPDREFTEKKGAARLLSRMTRRLTILLIPHTERKVLHFHVNLLVIILAVAVFALIFGGFMYLASSHIAAVQMVEEQKREVEENRRHMEQVLEDIQQVVRVTRSFENQVSSTAESLGIETVEEGSQDRPVRGDLADFLDLQVISEDLFRDIQDLQTLPDILSQTLEPLRGVRTALEQEQNLLADLPNLWPVAHGFGRVTREFGPNVHPVTGQWYLHKGIQIAGAPGTPVLASANGRVVEMGFDREHGLYVFLRHKYGFRTRYSHLQSIRVLEGEDVIQGQQIGALGATGMVTGPELGFMIMLGTDVVDPAGFLRISTDVTRVSQVGR